MLCSLLCNRLSVKSLATTSLRSALTLQVASDAASASVRAPALFAQMTFVAHEQVKLTSGFVKLAC